jgi:hypothetical protein
MMRIQATAVLLFALAGRAFGQAQCAPGTGERVLIHGAGHAFTISAPAGWVATAGYADQPAPALLTRQGETWRDAPAVMYVNTALPDSGQLASAKTVMRDDSLRFVAEYPAVVFATLPSVQTADGRRVFIRKFVGGGYGSVDLVAYVDERTVTPLIVLSSRTEAQLAGALPAFHALLRSYRYVAVGRPTGLPCGAA